MFEFFFIDKRFKFFSFYAFFAENFVFFIILMVLILVGFITSRLTKFVLVVINFMIN